MGTFVIYYAELLQIIIKKKNYVNTKALYKFWMYIYSTSNSIKLMSIYFCCTVDRKLLWTFLKIYRWKFLFIFLVCMCVCVYIFNNSQRQWTHYTTQIYFLFDICTYIVQWLCCCTFYIFYMVMLKIQYIL